MTASSGASSLLLQPIPSPTLPAQTLSVSVPVNQAIVAAATDGTATVEYWVRCLPPDFPLLQWTPHPEAGAITPGYYMVGTDEPTTSGCYAMVLDGNGVPVWYAQALPALGWCVFDVDSVVPGAISLRLRRRLPRRVRVSSAQPAHEDEAGAGRAAQRRPARARAPRERRLPRHLEPPAARGRRRRHAGPRARRRPSDRPRDASRSWPAICSRSRPTGPSSGRGAPPITSTSSPTRSSLSSCPTGRMRPSSSTPSTATRSTWSRGPATSSYRPVS